LVVLAHLLERVVEEVVPPLLDGARVQAEEAQARAAAHDHAIAAARLRASMGLVYQGVGAPQLPPLPFGEDRDSGAGAEEHKGYGDDDDGMDLGGGAGVASGARDGEDGDLLQLPLLQLWETQGLEVPEAVHAARHVLGPRVVAEARALLGIVAHVAATVCGAHGVPREVPEDLWLAVQPALETALRGESAEERRRQLEQLVQDMEPETESVLDYGDLSVCDDLSYLNDLLGCLPPSVKGRDWPHVILIAQRLARTAADSGGLTPPHVHPADTATCPPMVSPAIPAHAHG
jgi:hypothetical protein